MDGTLRQAAGNVAKSTATFVGCIRAGRVNLRTDSAGCVDFNKPRSLPKVGSLVGPGKVLGIGLCALALDILGGIQDVPGGHRSTGAIHRSDELALQLCIKKIGVATNRRSGGAKADPALLFGTGHTQGAAKVPSTSGRRQATNVALRYAGSVATRVGAAVLALGVDAASATGTTEVSVLQWIDTGAAAVHKARVAKVNAATSRAALAFVARVFTGAAEGRVYIRVYTLGLADDLVWITTSNAIATGIHSGSIATNTTAVTSGPIGTDRL